MCRGAENPAVGENWGYGMVYQSLGFLGFSVVVQLPTFFWWVMHLVSRFERNHIIIPQTSYCWGSNCY